MNYLIESTQSTCESGGVVYTINTNYAAALWTWSAWYAYDAREIDAASYAYAVCQNMFLDPKPEIWNEDALKLAGEYLNAFSDKDGDRRTQIPPIDIEQDSAMIYGALLSVGVHLKKDSVTYEDFLSYLRNLPEGCEYARIMYLRMQWYDNRAKMTKEERESCKRIGWDKIKIRNRKAEKDTADNSDYFKQLQNKMRAERGLPPL